MTFKTTLAILAMASLPALALEDTEANRTKAAGRYLQAVPITELTNDLIEQMGKNQTPEKKAWIRMVLTNCIDAKALESIIRTTMVKVFTADELEALADFYSSKAGKSAMRKFGLYVAESMPLIQAETLKAIEKSKLMAPEPR